VQSKAVPVAIAVAAADGLWEALGEDVPLRHGTLLTKQLKTTKKTLATGLLDAAEALQLACQPLQELANVYDMALLLTAGTCT
jgi:hypothetical protein